MLFLFVLNLIVFGIGMIVVVLFIDCVFGVLVVVGYLMLIVNVVVVMFVVLLFVVGCWYYCCSFDCECGYMLVVML